MRGEALVRTACKKEEGCGLEERVREERHQLNGAGVRDDGRVRTARKREERRQSGRRVREKGDARGERSSNLAQN